MVNFWTHFWFLSSNIALLGPEKNKNHVPWYLKTFKKMKEKKYCVFSPKKIGYDFLDPQNGQNTNVNLAKNGRFLDPFSIFEL